jgi:hypothetical protein
MITKRLVSKASALVTSGIFLLGGVMAQQAVAQPEGLPLPACSAFDHSFEVIGAPSGQLTEGPLVPEYCQPGQKRVSVGSGDRTTLSWSCRFSGELIPDFASLNITVKVAGGGDLAATGKITSSSGVPNAVLFVAVDSLGGGLTTSQHMRILRWRPLEAGVDVDLAFSDPDLYAKTSYTPPGGNLTLNWSDGRVESLRLPAVYRLGQKCVVDYDIGLEAFRKQFPPRAYAANDVNLLFARYLNAQFAKDRWDRLSGPDLVIEFQKFRKLNAVKAKAATKRQVTTTQRKSKK